MSGRSQRGSSAQPSGADTVPPAASIVSTTAASVAPAGTLSVVASTKSSLRSHGAAPRLSCWTLHAWPWRPASGGNSPGVSNATRSNCARESLYGGFAAF
ncbi:hypothetical protein BvRS1_45450 [Burkholderia vietnamiensis]|nr:hypothetical protein BvRS1_45450 [Burkholderia vietnamiensis]